MTVDIGAQSDHGAIGRRARVQPRVM